MDDPLAGKKQKERARLELNRKLKREMQEKMEQRLRDTLGKPVNGVTLLYADELQNLQECPALDRRWVGGKPFVAFLPGDDASASSEVLDMLASSLRELLVSPYHEFWSHVLFDASLREFIDTYLRYTPRSFDDDYQPYSGKDSRSLVFERVYKVLLRAATCKDSKDWFMDPEYHQAWMRSKTTWFDMPHLMDICTLFHKANLKQTQTLVSEAFRSNNKLFEDLKKLSQATVTTLGKAFGKSTTDARMLRDRELFLDDCLCSLYALFMIFPKAMRQFQLNTRLLQMLGVDCHGQWLLSLSSSLSPARHARMVRLCVAIGWKMLDFCYLTRVFESGTNKYQPAVADQLWALLDTWMGTDFLAQIQEIHELSSALRKVMDKGTGVPRDRVAAFCAKLDVSQDKVRLAIQNVVSAVPGIGPGFARAALYAMGLNEQAVVDALKTQQLPLALRSLDRQSGLQPQFLKKDSEDDKGKGELCAAELDEERGPVQFGTIHVGKKALVVEDEFLDHRMRVFISRYADSYEDEVDDSFSVHAKLAVEPLAEDEEEEQIGAAAGQEQDTLLTPITQPEPPTPSAPAGRGRGQGKHTSNPAARKKHAKKDTAYRKNASLKKHGMLNPK